MPFTLLGPYRSTFSLPGLKHAIDEQLRGCHIELAKLPAPLATDPSTEFLLRVTAFCSDFRAAVFGEARKSLVQHNRQQFLQLKSDIYKTCPDFRPFEDYSKYHRPTTLEGPTEYGKMPMDLNEVQKVIDELVTPFALKSLTLIFSQFHRLGITWLCPFRRNEGTCI